MYLRTYVSQGDLCSLAEEQNRQGLLPEDRTRLGTAAQRVSNRRNLGCVLGSGLGLLVAHGTRKDRKTILAASKTAKDWGRGAPRNTGHHTGPQASGKQLTEVDTG